MKRLSDIKGNVRGDGQYYSLRDFIRPYEPLVMEVASVLDMSEDPVKSAHELVHKIVKYRKQNIEYWEYPTKIMMSGEGDCDESATLLCSILRNYLPAEDVFVAVGFTDHKDEGHAWVIVRGEIVESTASPEHVVDTSQYRTEVMFNDRLAFAETNEFGFIMIGEVELQGV